MTSPAVAAWSADHSGAGEAWAPRVIARGGAEKCSTREELFEYRGEGFRLHVVRLAFEDQVPGVGEDLRKRTRAVVEPRGALAADDDKRGHGDGPPPLGRQGVAVLRPVKDGGVVRERVRNRLEPRPQR